MTTRTRTVDLRRSLSTAGYLPSSYPTDKIGSYYKKYQLGANSPDYPDVLLENDYSTYSEDSSEFAYRIWDKYYATWFWRSTVNTYFIKDTQFTAADYTSALGDLNSRMEGSKFSPGTAIGELPETLRMMRDRTKSVASAMFYLRRGQVNDFLRSLFGNTSATRRGLPGRIKPEAIPSVWLEYQYGWKPLLGDIVDGATWMTERLSGQRIQKVRVVRRKEFIQDQETAPYIYPWSPTRHSRLLILTANVDAGSPPGLSVMDPLSDIWNLIPGSFIADWFLDVGSWLEALDTIFTVGANGIPITKSELYEERRGPVYRGRLANKAYSSQNYMEMSEVYRRFHYVNYVRDGQWALPTPKIAFSWLDPSKTRDVTRLKNAVALAAANGRRLFS